MAENSDFINREGCIIWIGEQEYIGQRKTPLRKFAIEVISTYKAKDGTMKENKNQLCFECDEKRIELINQRSIGDRVKVGFTINGAKWKDSYFNKLKCWSIALIAPVQQGFPQQGYVQPNYPPQGYQQPSYAPQGQYQQPPQQQYAPNYVPVSNPVGTPYVQGGGTYEPNIDQLPF